MTKEDIELSQKLIGIDIKRRALKKPTYNGWLYNNGLNQVYFTAFLIASSIKSVKLWP